MSLSTGCVFNVDASAIESGISRDRNHHILSPTDTTTVRGKACKGTYFNGNTSYLDCGAPSSLYIIDALTIEIWVKPKSVAMGTLISNEEADVKGYSFFLTAGGILNYRTSQTPGMQTTITSTTISTTNWQYIVLSRTGTTAKIYINSIEASYSAQPAHTNQVFSDISTKICRYGTSGAAFFDGTISSVRIYNYALSPTQIKRNYLSKAYIYQSHPVRIP